MSNCSSSCDGVTLALASGSESWPLRWDDNLWNPAVRGEESQNEWNLLAGGAYHLAGGGPCIAIDVGPSSPLAGNSAPNAASRLCRVESRHLLVRVNLWGRPAGRQARLLRQRPLRMGACGATSVVWRFCG